MVNFEEKVISMLNNLQEGQKSMRQDIEELQQGQKKLEHSVKNLEESVERIEKQRIIDSNNIAKILMQQTKMNQKLEEHIKIANFHYQELDSRISVLEMKNKVS